MSQPDPLIPEETAAGDAILVERILAGDEASFELLMRRNNQRLFRAARSIVGNASDAEDVLQESYFKAYCALERFEGRSRLGSWLLRITVNEALNRADKSRRVVPLHGESPDTGAMPDEHSSRAPGWLGGSSRNPESFASDVELHRILADAVDRLPDSLRTVFVLRSVEEMSVEETAECLDLSAEAVRVRLHRANAALRTHIDRRLTEQSRRLFSFGYERCDRVVANVLDRIRRERA